MYRVAKKTTQKTQYYCLDCKHCNQLDKEKGVHGCYVECTADNKYFLQPFNSRDFYCKEFENLNTMNNSKKQKIIDAILKDYEKKSYKEYCFKFYAKKQAQRMYKVRYG